jgi:hypothetical protein
LWFSQSRQSRVTLIVVRGAADAARCAKYNGKKLALPLIEKYPEVIFGERWRLQGPRHIDFVRRAVGRFAGTNETTDIATNR